MNKTMKYKIHIEQDEEFKRSKKELRQRKDYDKIKASFFDFYKTLQNKGWSYRLFQPHGAIFPQSVINLGGSSIYMVKLSPSIYMICIYEDNPLFKGKDLHLFGITTKENRVTKYNQIVKKVYQYAD